MVSQDLIVNKLRELARNLWWTWQPNVVELFRELDPVLWRETDHNPVVFLDRIPPDQLDAAGLGDGPDLADRLRLPPAQRVPGATTIAGGPIHASTLRARPVAYFSMEFGLHESLPIYSGGLGVLAGDHLKSASDLGLPLVGVGILYAEGYFRQALDAEGWQHGTLPLQRARPACRSRRPSPPTASRPAIAIDTHSGTLHAKVWRVEVGRRPCSARLQRPREQRVATAP